MRELNRKLGFPVWLPLLLGVMLFWLAQYLQAGTRHSHHVSPPVHRVAYRLVNV